MVPPAPGWAGGGLMGDLLGAAVVRRLLGMSPGQFERAIKAERIPYVLDVMSNRRFDPDVIAGLVPVLNPGGVVQGPVVYLDDDVEEL